MKDNADKLLEEGKINAMQLCQMIVGVVEGHEEEKERYEKELQKQIDIIADVFNEDEEVVIYCFMKLWLEGLGHNLDFVKAYVDNIDFVGKMQIRFEKLC